MRHARASVYTLLHVGFSFSALFYVLFCIDIGPSELGGHRAEVADIAVEQQSVHLSYSSCNTVGFSMVQQEKPASQVLTSYTPSNELIWS